MDRNEIAFQWTTLSGQPKLIVGGVLPGSDARFYFVQDVSGLESALGLLRFGLGGGALILALVALVAARWIARGVLAPVEAASRAAERIERGDFSARVPVASNDEFGIVGGDGSTGWPPPWRTRSAGCRRPNRRTASSSPMSRMNSGHRWRRSSRKRRSCATTSTRCRPGPAAPASCWSATSLGSGRSSTT